MTGGVFAQLVEGADAVRGAFGGGREGMPWSAISWRVIRSALLTVVRSIPDERADGGAGEAKVVAEPDGQDVVGEVDAAVAAGCATVADGVDAAVRPVVVVTALMVSMMTS